MSLRFRSLQTLLRRSAAVASLCLLTVLASSAQAQVHMVVDSKGSLAWWQIDPNMAHLWGTTCPQEPSWRAGEGRSGGWTTEEAANAKTLAHGFNQKSDTVNVPLYPRRRIRYVCSEALSGQVTLPDTSKWRGAQGQVTVRVKEIVTGESMRDKYEQDAVLSVAVYPEIKFTLDSIVGPSRKGDTTWAVGVGTWTLRGVTKPVMAGLKWYPDAGGVTRVLAKWKIPVRSLVDDYGVWKRTLGLGVMMGIWKSLFMGVDLVLRPESQVRIGQ